MVSLGWPERMTPLESPDRRTTMGKHEVQGTGYLIADWASDTSWSYPLVCIAPDGRIFVGIADLIRDALGVTLDEDRMGVLERVELFARADAASLREQEYYRKETGRQYPPLFRFHITVEADELPAEEVAAYWEGQQALSRKAAEEAAKEEVGQ